MRSKLVFIGGVVILVILWQYAVKNSELHTEPIGNQDDLSVVAHGSFVNLSSFEALELLRSDEDVFLVDVHTPEQEHLAGTDALVPFDEVSERISEFPDDKEKAILVYCRSGNMSETASSELVKQGFTQVYNLVGGVHAWRGAGYRLDEMVR